jgi:hypothetical protein
VTDRYHHFAGTSYLHLYSTKSFFYAQRWRQQVPQKILVCIFIITVSHHITSHHSLTDDVLPTNREYKHSTREQKILSLRLLLHRPVKKGHKNFSLSFSFSGNQPYLL